MCDVGRELFVVRMSIGCPVPSALVLDVQIVFTGLQ